MYGHFCNELYGNIAHVHAVNTIDPCALCYCTQYVGMGRQLQGHACMLLQLSSISMQMQMQRTHGMCSREIAIGPYTWGGGGSRGFIRTPLFAT